MTAADEVDICAPASWRSAPCVEGFSSDMFAGETSIHACLVDSSPVALCLIDRRMRFVIVNEAMSRILGRSAKDLIGSSVSDRIEGAPDILEQCFADADAGSPVRGRIMHWQSGHYQLSFNPVRERNGRVRGLTVAALDRSRRTRFERRMRDSRRRLASIARRDDLTGLLNRRGLDFRLGRTMRGSPGKKQPLALLVVDVDRFKAYNDSLGHAAGDRCLRAVAGALGGCLRRTAALAGRYGGEEFLIVLPDTDHRGAVLVAEECRRAVEGLRIPHPVTPGGYVTVSVGLTVVVPERAMGLAGLGAGIEEADRALYRAKQQGRNRVIVSGH